MKRKLAILIFIVFLSINVRATEKIVTINQGQDFYCEINKIEERGFTNYYMNSTIDLMGADILTDAIYLQLPPMENILYENNNGNSVYNHYMHFDFDGGEIVNLYYSEGERDKNYKGFLNDGTVIQGSYDYYTSYSLNSKEFFMVYAGLDLIGTEFGDSAQGRIRYLLRYNETTEEYIGCGIHDGYIIFKSSSLELWQQSVISSVQDLLGGNILNRLGFLEDKIDIFDERIDSLENRPQLEINVSTLNYWKYLSSSDRKNIVCGIATDNRLNTITMQELGWKCDLTYRQTSNGEKSSCRCSKI